MPAGDVQIDEVNHHTQPEAVDQVTQCAAHDERESETEPRPRLQRAELPDDPAADGQRNQRKEPALPTCMVCQKTERRTWVKYQHQIEERG